jgi:hypothetical protein
MQYRTEGEAAIKDLNSLAAELGYTDRLNQEHFLHFLKNNPGCVEMIHDWIADQYANRMEEENDLD